MTHHQAAAVDQPVVIYGERGAAAEAETQAAISNPDTPSSYPNQRMGEQAAS